MKLGNGTAQLRSLIVFVVDEISKSSFNKLPSGFKLLTVLDLENAPIEELPGEFGDLFNLRYLNLTRTQVKEIPKSIGKFFKLQSLLLKNTQIRKLPREIVNLQILRHLRASFLSTPGIDSTLELIQGIDVPSNICTIKSLQVLAYVKLQGSLSKLREMTQLTRLGLDGLTEADEKDLCFAIEKMERLHHLSLSAVPEGLIKMDALSSVPPYLEKLDLFGKLEKVPRWFNSLLNLKSLMLQRNKLREDHVLSHIQSLPNLLTLCLSNNAFEGERLCFVEGFKKLQFLSIRRCPHLREIVIEKGVMPGLKKLYVLRCKEFRTMPYDWENVTDLEEVRFYDVSNELVHEIICGNGNDNLPTKPYILLTRTNDDDEAKSKSKWVYKILN